MADRSLGNAMGVLAPVRLGTDGRWHVAARADVVFMLTEVVVDAWSELRFASGGEEAQRRLDISHVPPSPLRESCNASA
jgi:hypothetical protein